jgi:hypothetical protein
MGAETGPPGLVCGHEAVLRDGGLEQARSGFHRYRMPGGYDTEGFGRSGAL